MKYYKVLNKKENHNRLQYHTGRVDDPLPFSEEGSCVPGGIYFTDVKNLCSFLEYGPYIREVTVPEDAQMVQDPGTDALKYRASSVILGEREEWTDPKVFKRLLDEGMDIHVKDDFALRWASDNGHVEVVELLLEAGANVHAKSDEALCWASFRGHVEVVKLLLEAGADVHAYNDYALRLASRNGHIEVVKLLLEAGADVHAKDDEALRWASRYGHVEVVKLLLEAGADVHANNDEALRWASRHGHVEVVKLLKEYV